MLKKILFLSIFSLLVSYSIVHGYYENKKVSAQIVDFGIYELVGHSIVVNSPETAVGKRRLNTKPKFIERTSEIPAILGKSFGLQYKIYGMPKNSYVELKKILIHPKIKGKTGSSRKLVYMTDSEGSVEKATGYTFDEEFELMTGTWTFEIWYEDQLLVKKSFNVVPQI